MSIAKFLNLNPLTSQELAELSTAFYKACAKSNSVEGRNLPIYASHINKTLPMAPQHEPILVIELGGTHIRLAIFDTQSQQISHLKKTKNNAVQQEFSTHLQFLTAKISNYIVQLPDQFQSVSAAAFVFSFAGNVVENGNFLDITREGFPDSWGKGFELYNSSLNISQALRNSLQKQGREFQEWVSLNDVTALLCAQRDTAAALIVGTGFNIGVSDVQGTIFNTEAGDFVHQIINNSASLPAKTLKTSAKISETLNEMQIGGRYLGHLLANSLVLLGEADPGLLGEIRQMQSAAVSCALLKRYDNFVHHEEARRSLNLLHEIAYLMCYRISDLLAAQLAGSLMFGNALQKPKVAIEGATLLGIPGLVHDINLKVAKLIHTPLTFIAQEHSNLLGAARALIMHKARKLPNAPAENSAGL